MESVVTDFDAWFKRFTASANTPHDWQRTLAASGKVGSEISAFKMRGQRRIKPTELDQWIDAPLCGGDRTTMAGQEE